MSRAWQGAGVSRGGTSDTKTVPSRAKQLSPITKAVCWQDLPTLPSGDGKDAPLELEEVVRRATSNL
jgi:hypothetical protein